MKHEERTTAGTGATESSTGSRLVGACRLGAVFLLSLHGCRGARQETAEPVLRSGPIASADPVREAPTLGARADVRYLDVAGAAIEISIQPGERAVSDDEIVAWIERSARAVASFYGRFPVKRVSISVLSARGRGVRDGMTRGSVPISIEIGVGDRAGASDLARDWTMTHELIHSALPSLASEHHWLEEGIATYVEPIARARSGLVRPEDVWREWIRDYHQGLPGAGDRGLDHAPEWGRTYYGGAIFCLLADVEIRRRTDNRHSLQDALAAIVRAGGGLSVSWPIERVIAVGDDATGTTVLDDFYARFGRRSEPVDLEALWRDLGVSLRGRKIVIDERAPLAAVRRALVGG